LRGELTEEVVLTGMCELIMERVFATEGLLAEE